MKRRLTLFPKTGSSQDERYNTVHNEENPTPIRGPLGKLSATARDELANSVYDKENLTPVGGSTRKFSGDAIVDLELPKSVATASKVLVPIDRDPEIFYQCIYVVEPNGARPYCLAQEKTLVDNECPYRIVMIRRSARKKVLGTKRPNTHLLNILGVYQFNDSLYTIIDRPDVPLSEVALCHSPQLGLAQIQTISKEALLGMSALVEAGLFLHKILLEDVTISPYNGQVKIGFDQAVHQGLGIKHNGSAFKSMLEQLLEDLPNTLALTNNKDVSAFIESASHMEYAELQQHDFLKNSLPARSLIPFVLTAQVTVISVEHEVGIRISDLKVGEESM